jgi:F0F1-type ATP synthase membrane subunit a
VAEDVAEDVVLVLDAVVVLVVATDNTKVVNMRCKNMNNSILDMIRKCYNHNKFDKDRQCIRTKLMVVLEVAVALLVPNKSPEVAVEAVVVRALTLFL